MDTQSPISAVTRRRFSKRLLIALLVTPIMLAAAYAGIAKATDQPAFCGSACHEMGPFHSAWSQGAHKGISCVECHVDAGTIAGMEHKVVALGEVQKHVVGDYEFPMSVATKIPNERCIRCHPDVKLTSTGFSHAEHAKRGDCVMCHSTVGHSVTSEALKQAGVYNASTKAAFDTTETAVVDGGKANLPGHVAVPCSRCHVMADAPCSGCHKPPHVDRGPNCAECHAPGPKFVFTHPSRTDCGTCHKPTNAKHTWTGACTDCHKAGPGVSFAVTHPTNTACATCHPRPAKHRAGDCTSCHHNAGKSWAFAHPASGACASCHDRPANHKPGECSTCHHNTGKNWAYAHPGSGADCTSCHARPAVHKNGSCTTCHHNVGANWKFSHPGSKANCASCHPRPARHRSGSCTSCHSVGKSWKFSHPGSGANCASCHPRPGGHRAGACQSCHIPGAKWTFRHTNSSSCSQCHNAPSGHYGTTCQNCHSPSRAWASATFNHPRVPGGQHTYKSFACVKCHPSGPPAHFCSCHGNTTGPKGD